MVELIYALAAQRVLNDRETNSVSYIEVIDGFNVPSLPAALPPFTVSSMWDSRNENASLFVRLVVTGPDGQVIGSPMEFPVQPVSAGKRHRVNMAFAGFPAPIAGEYRFRMEQKLSNEWVDAGGVSLSVNYLSPPPQVLVQQGEKRVKLGH